MGGGAGAEPGFFKRGVSELGVGYPPKIIQLSTSSLQLYVAYIKCALRQTLTSTEAQCVYLAITSWKPTLLFVQLIAILCC